MDIDELKNLRTIRKKCNIGQKKFASSTGVSQSTIAKIENGSLEPSLKLARRILKELSSLTARDTLTAKDVMEKNVITFDLQTFLIDAVEKMKEEGISQVPVVENGKIVGTVTESSIISNAIGKDIIKLSVSSVVEELLPTIPPDSKMNEVKYLLREHRAVLVVSRGSLLGIITPSDVVYNMDLFLQ